MRYTTPHRVDLSCSPPPLLSSPHPLHGTQPSHDVEVERQDGDSARVVRLERQERGCCEEALALGPHLLQADGGDLEEVVVVDLR